MRSEHEEQSVECSKLYNIFAGLLKVSKLVNDRAHVDGYTEIKRKYNES